MTLVGPRDTEAFAEYHRGGLVRRVTMVCLGGLVGGAVVTGMIAVGLTAPSLRPTHASPAAAAPAVSRASSTTTLAAIDAAGSSSSSSSAVPDAPAVLAATGTAAYSISITATGYQAELDRCQWVRMDLMPGLPIVGAHTSCGGAAVLKMNAGDQVTLAGQGLDGRYRVGEARDAHAGDLASTATAGMTGSVALQTCYPGSGGRERLVALIPLP